MRCKFINDIKFITSLLAYKMYEPFWDYIFIMFVFILFIIHYFWNLSIWYVSLSNIIFVIHAYIS